jgi:hypothetical protein
MKTLILLFGLNFNQNVIPTIGKTASEISEPQQNAVRAYLLYQGQFVDGTIGLQRTQFGARPVNYQFAGMANRQTSGQFYPDSQFVPLNPNNQYAVRYNFTHYISVPGLGTAYVTL